MTHQQETRRLSISTVPVPGWLESRALRGGSARTKHLAEPPPGSGLRAVPGDAGLPLVGQGLEWMRYGPRFERARVTRYGPVSWMKAFGMKMAMVGGADATQAVLTNKDKAFSQSGWNLFFDPFFKRGLLMLDAEHLQHRRIMQQAFTRPRLAGYAGVAGQVVRAGLADLPDRFTVHPAMARLTMGIGSQVFMASALETNEPVLQAFRAAVDGTTALARFSVPGGKWQAGSRGRKMLEEYFTAALPGKRSSDGSDLFSVLASAQDEDGQRFTDTEIVDHMIFLMVAALDTSATTATAAMYYLARHPEWQERARAESVALGPAPDIDGLDQLTTLDLVVKESLRLVAPVPTFVRRTVRDVDLTGYHLPAGTTTIVMPAANHYDPAYWREPDAFDPDRFAEPRREDQAHRFAFVPFGGGAHKCIGMVLGFLEVKTILHELLLRHRWRLPEGYRMRWDWSNTPVPTGGLPVHLDRV
ncbi:cytochrome P450 [Lentzea sp. NPDC058436]|uniref:cytochrome P450 n=1 Tax=Lentzea sp. NPDC058436 TaxID=3346499 RepID=UPI00365B464E